MPSVLILDGNSGPAVATARSLGRAGFTVLAGAGTRAGASRHTAGCIGLPLPDDDPDAFLHAVNAALPRYRIDLLAPSSDAAVELAWSGDGLALPILGGDYRSFMLASDKLRTLAAADEAGFPAPAWAAPATLAGGGGGPRRPRAPRRRAPR